MLPEFIRRPYKGWKEHQRTEEEHKQHVIDRGIRATKLRNSTDFVDTCHEELDQLIADMLSIEPDTEEKQFQLLRLHARARGVQQLALRLESAIGQAEVQGLQKEMEKEASDG